MVETKRAAPAALFVCVCQLRKAKLAAMTRIRTAARAIVALFAALAITSCASPNQWSYSAEPIESRVVDEETGQPLEGVVVVANWLLMTGTAGGRSQLGPLMVLEAVSDANGRFSFPAWGPLSNRMLGFLDHEDPELWFFKPGYYLSRRANDYTNDYRSKPSRRKSDWNGKAIPLRRFAGSEDAYAEQVARQGYSLSANLKWYEDCTIARTPNLAFALDRENRRMEERGFRKGGFIYRSLLPEFLSRCKISIPESSLK